MLDIGSTELLMIIIVAIVVIGPKDLPRALYKVGQVVGKAKGVVRHFRTGVDAMVREVELEEMEKKWKADNERIMREHAAPAAVPALATDTPKSDIPKSDAPQADTPETAPVMQPLAAPATAGDMPDAASASPNSGDTPPPVTATEGER